MSRHSILLRSLLAAFSIVAAHAFAEGEPKAPDPAPSSSSSNSMSSASSNAAGIGVGVGIGSGGKANANAQAAGGNATAFGGEGGHGGNATAVGAGGTGGRASASQTQVAQGGSATQSQETTSQAYNEGNDTSVALSSHYQEVRQVPPVFLPAILTSDCGAGWNAGGSKDTGAGALGFTYTTQRCYALRSALNFFAIGEYETGCELLVYVNRKAFKWLGKRPDCRAIARQLEREATSAADHAQPIAATPPASPRYVTQEELERAFKAAVEK